MLGKVMTWGCVLAMLAGSATAMADPLLQGTTLFPTGITGLVVDGVTYDVSFSEVPGVSPFSAGSTQSADAAAALASALNSFSVQGLEGIGLQAGISLGLMVDGTLTGDAATILQPVVSSLWSTSFFATSFSPGGWGAHLTCNESVPACEGPVAEAANFTAIPATVPEPGSLLLLGFELAVLGGLFAENRIYRNRR